MEEQTIYTETMAKIYVEQGLVAKAIHIYRHLLAREPHRRDLQEALEALEASQTDGDQPNLVPLVEQWFHLMFSYKKLQRLNTLRSRK